MKLQQGFTLFELMIVIVIVGMLSAIALPSYQRYIQKAALVEALQIATSYRTDIELCYLQYGELTVCNSGQSGISAASSTRYLSSASASQGSITLIGKGLLEGLSIKIDPVVTASRLHWQRLCQASNNPPLITTCETIFQMPESVQ